MCYSRPQDAADRAKVSKSTIWRWVREGKLPKPRKLSHGVTVWRKEDLDDAFEALFSDGGAV